MTNLPLSGKTATRNYSKRAVSSTEKEANMVERAESAAVVYNCATADCERNAYGQAEIEDTGWHWYCKPCFDDMWQAGYRIRARDPEAPPPNRAGAEADRLRKALEAIVDRLTAADGVSLAQGNAAAFTARVLAEHALRGGVA